MQLLPDNASSDLPPLPRVQATIARRSLAEFFRRSWHVLEPATPLLWNWHLQAMCDHVQALLEGRIPEGNLLLEVPPGSAKSRVISVAAPAWWWIDHPYWRAIFSSGNPSVSVRDSLYCRNLMQSRWYQETFDPAWKFSGDQNAKKLYTNDQGGFRMAVSAGQKITGDRAHALFWDDLLDVMQAPSKKERERVNYWLDHAFSNRLTPGVGGIRCGIMQRLHDEDPAGHVRKQGTYAVLSIPQEYEPPDVAKGEVKPVSPIGWTDPRTQRGELMAPVMFTPKFLKAERIRLGKTTGFSAQHNQKPAPAGGIVFKRDWWRFYRLPDGWEAMPKAQLYAMLGVRRVASGWDTALTEKNAGDFTSNHVIGQCDARFLVLHHHKERMEYPAVARAVQANHAAWGPEGIPIEGGGSASGKAIVQGLRSNTTLPVLEVPNISKEIRAARVSPTVEGGIVLLPENAPWVEEFIDSMSRFPRGAHDDDVDSFCITLEWLLFGNATTGLLEYYRQLAEQAEAMKRGAGAA